jgi:flagellar capping protein FliD
MDEADVEKSGDGRRNNRGRYSISGPSRKRDFAQTAPQPAGDETEEWDSSADDEAPPPIHPNEEIRNKRRRLLERAERFEQEMAQETKSLTKLLEKFVDETEETTRRVDNADSVERRLEKLEARQERMEARHERIEARQEETLRTMVQLIAEVRDSTDAILALLKTQFAGQEQGQ